MPDLPVDKLCSTSDRASGVTTHHVANDPVEKIVLTYASVGAQVYEAQSHANTQSWSARPGVRISSPVEYHSKSDKLLCVEDDKTICMWSPSEPMASATRRGFKHKISRLHVSPDLDEFVVVLANGTVVICNTTKELETVHTSRTPKKCSVLSSAICDYKSRTFLCVLRLLAGNKAKPPRMIVNIHQIERADGKITTEESLVGAHVVKSPGQASAAPQSITFQVSTRSLALLWDNGTCQLFSFPSGLSPWESFGLTPKLTFTTTIELREACLAFVAQHRLAACGLAPDGQPTMTVIESVYGTTQAVVLLDASPSKSTRPAKKARGAKQAQGALAKMAVTREGQSCVCALPSAVYIVDTSSLSTSAVPSLASVIGAMKSSGAVAPMHTTFPLQTTLAAVEDPAQIRDQCTAIMAECGHKEAELMGKLLPAGKAITAKQFEKLFDAFINGSSSGKKRSAAGDSKQKQPVLSNHLVRTLSRHCLDAEMWAPLQRLIRTDLLSARECPELVERLAVHHRGVMLCDALLHVHDLSEAQVVRAVQFALASQAGEAEEEEQTCKRMLELAISSNVSEAFLHDALKDLEGAELNGLLEVILTWAETYWSTNDGFSKKKYTVSRTPSFNQVITWANVLLDASFTDMLVRPSQHMHSLLQRLRGVTGLHLHLCADLAKVEPLLAIVETHKDATRITPTQPIPDYCVNVLAL